MNSSELKGVSAVNLLDWYLKDRDRGSTKRSLAIRKIIIYSLGIALKEGLIPVNMWSDV